MKIKDAISVVVAYKISAIWYERATKIETKYPHPLGNKKANNIKDELRRLAYRITEVQTAVFDPTVSDIRPEKPKEKSIFKERPPHPIQALIDSNGGIWKPSYLDDYFTNGKFTIKILDFAGFKVIKRGELMPIIKKVVKEKGTAPEYIERKIDPNAFDDLRYEGLG